MATTDGNYVDALHELAELQNEAATLAMKTLDVSRYAEAIKREDLTDLVAEDDPSLFWLLLEIKRHAKH